MSVEHQSLGHSPKVGSNPVNVADVVAPRSTIRRHRPQIDCHRTDARLNGLAATPSSLRQLLNNDIAGVEIVVVLQPELELFTHLEKVAGDLRRLSCAEGATAG
jgi:hypothetical protein